MGSPEGDRLRRLASKQSDLAGDVRRASRQFAVMAEQPNKSVRGFRFEGPFAMEIVGSMTSAGEWLRTVGAQLAVAASELDDAAQKTEKEAAAADVRYLAKLAWEKLVNRDG